MWCWCVNRLVHAGQRLEWQQRVQGGAQLQPESAPAMLQVKRHPSAHEFFEACSCADVLQTALP